MTSWYIRKQYIYIDQGGDCYIVLRAFCLFVCLDFYPAALEADECFIAQSAAHVKDREL